MTQIPPMIETEHAAMAHHEAGHAVVAAVAFVVNVEAVIDGVVLDLRDVPGNVDDRHRASLERPVGSRPPAVSRPTGHRSGAESLIELDGG